MNDLLFRLDIFEGPLDLLLHLIAKNRVSIYDIPIALITSQYLDYLKKMEDADLEIRSEFIVMAAKLLYIKSRVLLPQYDEDEEEDEDPRTELILSLAEYKKYKDVASFFDDRKSICDYIYFKQSGTTDMYKTKEKQETIPIDKLTLAFASVMERYEKSLPPSKMLFSGIVGREPVSVKSKQAEIKNKLKKHKNLKFHELFKEVESRSEIVAIFLAVLEMVRNDYVSITYSDDQILLNEINGDK